MQITWCVAKASPGCAVIWAKIPRRRSPIRKFFPASACACWACESPTSPRHAATIIPVRRMSHGLQLLHHLVVFRRQGQELNFFESGDELFEVMEHMERSMNVSSFFMMDENFLLQSAARDAAARPHEEGRQELVAVCLFVGECDSQVHHGGTGAVGRLLDLAGTGVAATRPM